MITLIVAARRKAGMSPEAFKEHWLERHAPLVLSVPEFARYLKKYALYPHAEGGNAPGNASVVTDARSYTYEVAGAIAGPFTPVYLTARAGATAPVLSTTGTGAAWGYTVPKAGESGQRAATSGIAVVRPAQV